ncbi:sterol desaturase/sphingolipid hydroxylase (fatty acid hydroxylase superfamily) [Knoellia remsis]|uniref:Sterol desaturase/sphingolipid hydroxylase (Fatty acid hydroxylase superfamily) n=1 Tax=Knoellia remsis TaxID=407159 RepID=A0A2T0UEJ2_9MICO|nr:sterol desaturase family protein [Knoellia remsis]PRY56294.1 sterol desaturase/sphingolipid hydroxylase (fatty acid hydroxylase superfamily) [Knoellia remsis]
MDSPWAIMSDPTHDPVLFALPFFALFIGLELLSLKYLDDHDEPGDPGRMGYAAKDTASNLASGFGSVVINLGARFAALFLYFALWSVAPWHLDASSPWTWVFTLLAVDLLWYAYHRASHRIRILWAAHQAHHSSVYFNYSVALRQKWNPWGELLFWTPLPLLGVPPWMIFFAFSLNLIYQFWVHTETIPKLWAPVEFVLNTPSHHRVHHASQKQYLDRNYGGILIVWDRLFGTYAEEEDVPVYGLTVPVTTHNPFRLQYVEFAAVFRDVCRARTWRERAGYLFGPPGWAPGHPTLPPGSETVTR